MYYSIDVHLTVPPEASADAVCDQVITSILECISNNPPLWKTWKERKDGQYKQQLVKNNE